MKTEDLEEARKEEREILDDASQYEKSRAELT